MKTMGCVLVGIEKVEVFLLVRSSSRRRLAAGFTREGIAVANAATAAWRRIGAAEQAGEATIDVRH